MSLTNWFRKSPASSPRLDALISKVVLYLKSRPDDDQIVPKIVGKAIGESEIRAITALRILEQRGIVKQHFGLYCSKTSVPMGTYDELHDIPNSFPCEVCDEEHSQSEDDCKVEIFYTIDKAKLARFMSNVTAA